MHKTQPKLRSNWYPFFWALAVGFIGFIALIHAFIGDAGKNLLRLLAFPYASFLDHFHIVHSPPWLVLLTLIQSLFYGWLIGEGIRKQRFIATIFPTAFVHVALIACIGIREILYWH